MIYHAPISYWQNCECIYIKITFKLANVFISKLHLYLQQFEIESFTYAPNQPWPSFPASPSPEDNQAWKNIPTRNFLGAWNKTWLGAPIHLLPFQLGNHIIKNHLVHSARCAR